MRISPIYGDNDIFWNPFVSLYLKAFPDCERRPLPGLVRLLEMQKKRYRLLAILEEERFVGFFGLWHFDKFVYVEHFAIVSEKRGAGVGSEALHLLMKEESLPFILEVEIPADKQTRRRVSFYQRLGFCMSDVYYWQPPYSPSLEGLELRLMLYRQEAMPAIEEVIQTIHKDVYNYSDSQI